MEYLVLVRRGLVELPHGGGDGPGLLHPVLLQQTHLTTIKVTIQNTEMFGTEL